VSYPALTDGASCFIAPPCLLANPNEGREVLGGAPQAHWVAPTLLFLRAPKKR